MAATATGRGNMIARNVPKGSCTVTVAAGRIGISIDTLRRWCDLGIMPHSTVEMGKLTIRTFTAKDIAAGRRIRDKGEGRLEDRVPKR